MKIGIRIIFVVGLALVGNALECESSESLPAAGAVFVAQLEKELPREQEAASRFLWENFATKPEAKQFRSLSTRGWKQTAREFEVALLEKAQNLKLDAVALKRCLKAVSDETSGLAWVPVGAYLVTQEKQPIWIVVCRWESLGGAKEVQKLGHVRVFAYNTKRIRKVAFVTCT